MESSICQVVPPDLSIPFIWRRWEEDLSVASAALFPLSVRLSATH